MEETMIKLSEILNMSKEPSHKFVSKILIDKDISIFYDENKNKMEEEYSIKELVEELKKINNNLDNIAFEIARGSMGNGKK